MTGDDASQPQTAEPRELLLMRAGAHAFAVYADEAEGVTPWQEPVPLPHAPAAVLGVVCVRGRMRTVLDPVALLGAGAGSGSPAAPLYVVALRGDEQLALAVAHAERAAPPDARPAPPDPPVPFLRGTLPHAGHTLHLLDPARLFDAATRGAERRRPRQKR
jgi:chemotaxis signal transduction protein